MPPVSAMPLFQTLDGTWGTNRWDISSRFSAPHADFSLHIVFIILIGMLR